VNDAEARLAERLADDLERVLGAGIVLEDLEIEGEGPVTVRVSCLVEGTVREFSVTGENALVAINEVIRRAAETRLAAAFWRMVGPT
jgi:hypothetical protein